MRLHAAAFAATLLLLAPALLADEPAAAPAPGPMGPPRDPTAKPPPSARVDAAFTLNDTRVRAPTLPAWRATDECVLLESWGGTTILGGGVRAVWRAAEGTGAEIMRLTVHAPGRTPLAVEGRAPLELRLDGLDLADQQATRIELRAVASETAVVHQAARITLGMDVAGGPLEAKVASCPEV